MGAVLGLGLQLFTGLPSRPLQEFGTHSAQSEFGVKAKKASLCRPHLTGYSFKSREKAESRISFISFSFTLGLISAFSFQVGSYLTSLGLTFLICHLGMTHIYESQMRSWLSRRFQNRKEGQT